MAKTGLKTVFHGDEAEAADPAPGSVINGGPEPITAPAQAAMAAAPVPAVGAQSATAAEAELPSNLYITTAQFPFVRKWTKKPTMPPRPSLPASRHMSPPLAPSPAPDPQVEMQEEQVTEAETMASIWEKVDLSFYGLPFLSPESSAGVEIGGLIAWSVSFLLLLLPRGNLKLMCQAVELNLTRFAPELVYKIGKLVSKEGATLVIQAIPRSIPSPAESWEEGYEPIEDVQEGEAEVLRLTPDELVAAQATGQYRRLSATAVQV
jgi:hypothetical protein